MSQFFQINSIQILVKYQRKLKQTTMSVKLILKTNEKIDLKGEEESLKNLANPYNILIPQEIKNQET